MYLFSVAQGKNYFWSGGKVQVSYSFCYPGHSHLLVAHPVNTNEAVTLIGMLNTFMHTVLTSVYLKMIKHFVYVRPRNEVGIYRVSG
jgi:hypothetical protein